MLAGKLTFYRKTVRMASARSCTFQKHCQHSPTHTHTTQCTHTHTHLHSWYTDADKRRIVNRKTAAVEWLSVVGAATFRAPLASFYNTPTECVCVCVQVGACVCVHVAFAVLPLHTHSTLIDPTASSNKGFDFQHDKRQSQSRAGRVESALSFALPSQPVSQSTS